MAWAPRPPFCPPVLFTCPHGTAMCALLCHCYLRRPERREQAALATLLDKIGIAERTSGRWEPNSSLKIDAHSIRWFLACFLPINGTRYAPPPAPLLIDGALCGFRGRSRGRSVVLTPCGHGPLRARSGQGASNSAAVRPSLRSRE